MQVSSETRADLRQMQATEVGRSPEEVRFSLGRHTTAAEIDFALEKVPAAVGQLRDLSPTYAKKPPPAPEHQPSFQFLVSDF